MIGHGGWVKCQKWWLVKKQGLRSAHSSKKSGISSFFSFYYLSVLFILRRRRKDKNGGNGETVEKMEEWAVLRFDVKGGDKSERGYQRELLKNYSGWAEGFHPSLGSKTGIPDTMFLYGDRMFPIELKIGEIVEGILIVEDVRPAQIRWAKKFRKAGGVSSFLCGVVERGKWSSILLPFDQVIEPRQRFSLSDCERIEGYGHLFRIMMFRK